MDDVQQSKSRKRGVIRNRKITNPLYGRSYVPIEYINAEAIKECQQALELLAKRS